MKLSSLTALTTLVAVMSPVTLSAEHKSMASIGVEAVKSPVGEYLNSVSFLHIIIAFVLAVCVIVTLFNYMLRMRVHRDTKQLREYHRRMMFLNQSVAMLMENSDIAVFVYDMKYKRLQTLINGEICDCPMKNVAEFRDTLEAGDREKHREITRKLLSGEIDEATFSFNRVSRINGRPFYGEYHVCVKRDENGERRYLICLEKDETEHHQLLRKQNEIITSLDLALSSASLISWKYDIARERYYIMDGNLNKHNFSREEWHNMMSHEDCERFVQFAYNAAADDSHSNMMKLHLQLPDDAEPMPYELSITVRSNEKHEPIYFYGILNNVSVVNGYKTRIDQLEDRVRMALKAGDLAVWVYDIEKDSLSLFHDDVKHNLHMSRADLYDAVHPEDQAKLREAIREATEDKKTSGAVRFRYGEPHNWRWIEASFIIDENNKKVVTGLRRDITPLMHRTELIAQRSAELQEKSEQLQDMIRKNEQMIEELSVAKRHAEESDRMKSAFVANMSHEIRTPLNAIVGFSELLQYVDDPAERQEYINIIKNNNQLLIKLVNDVLDLSRIESGSVKLDIETFDAVDALDEIFETFNSKHNNPDVNFCFDNDFGRCELTLDRSRFYQVVNNYLTNAMKYTVKGGITMRLSEDGDGVRVSVKDSGIGIAKEKHHLVFQRFEKLDSFAPGTGLGLSISKAVAEAMGGRVGFDSEVGEGSNFWAWFPYNIATAIKHEEEDIKLAAKQPHNLLPL